MVFEICYSGVERKSRSTAVRLKSRLTRRSALSLAAALAVVAGGAEAAPPERSSEGAWAKGRLLVVPKAGLSPGVLVQMVGEPGGKASRLGGSNVFLIELPPQASETAVLARLQHNPHLKSAELDRQVKPSFAANDPYVGSAWHLPKIGASTAWDTSQGSGVTIAAIDTGVDSTHPDLSTRIVPGWNAHSNNSDTSDVGGHGTATAGAAAATTNNGIGVAGVAGQARIMPIRVAADSTGFAYYSTIASAITYAADKGARIANISYVDLLASSSIVSAAQYMKNKNGLVFMAAGNAGGQQSFTPTTAAILVSGTDGNDQLASWSSYGSFVSLSAPGQSIWTTSRGGGYDSWYGTSFSSPVAAGVGALVMAANPGLSAAQVESIIFSTAVDLGATGRDATFGYGRVDAAAAVRAALSTSVTPTDSQAPSAAITSPTGGSTVSGQVALAVGVNDNVGVTKVDLFVNGSQLATDSTSPFAFSWDSTKVSNGTANLQIVAYDAAGNSGTSSTVSVNVSNVSVVSVTDTVAPTVQLIDPKDGSQINSTVTITSAASDNAGSAGITQALYIDGNLVKSVTGGSLTYRWNTRKAASGQHSISLSARDAAGNTTSTAVRVYK